jgi:cellulose synthase/poly-beta-1,6-N-acetylglucosamine synthase-like glycosyltransferase
MHDPYIPVSWQSPLVGLFDIQFITILFLFHAKEFLAAFFAPGGNVLQCTVIIGKYFQYLPFFQARQFFPGFQKM